METPPPSDPVDAGALRRATDDGTEDWLVREEPLLISVDGANLLTMRTPGRDLDLVTGFLLGEGVVDRAEQVCHPRFEPGDTSTLRPDVMHVELDHADPARIAGRLTRTHEVRPSCGICGLTDPSELLEGTLPLLPGVPRLSHADLHVLRERLGAEQPLFAATGACHAAVVLGPDLTVWGSGEDVGRHNALDKAIGRAARDGHELCHGVVVLSGRAGFDLVLKCLRVRLPVIASVSAASALSFDLCRDADATLVGFLREGRVKVYWNGGRITAD